MRKEYLKIDKVEGPLIVLSNVKDAAYGEMVSIKIDGDIIRKGKIIKIDGSNVIIQVFEGTSGISTNNSAVQFMGEPMGLYSLYCLTIWKAIGTIDSY